MIESLNIKQKMTNDFHTNIAKLLLLEKGELTRSDIASLPWIKYDREIDLLISTLLQSFDAELRQRKIDSSFPEKEDYQDRK